MSYKREPIIKAITDNLSFSERSVSLNNVISLFDHNRIAQDFFRGLFSLVFGFKDLKNLDKLNDTSCNYPAIDLGDETARIAFQITTDTSSGKVTDTIKKFIAHKLYKKYDKLVMFFIGKKQRSYINFNTDGHFTFDKETDIWDSDYLVRGIDKIEDIEELEQIQYFLEKNLKEFKFPERLFEHDIKICIEILKQDFGSVTTMKQHFSRGDEDFIKQKNAINNLSWDFFIEKIRGHLTYNLTIVTFLQDEINRSIRNDYLEVSQAIQDFYEDDSNAFQSFEDVFRAIFEKINHYDNDTPGINVKLKILLHNMYFNCDIGTNPNKDA